MVQRTEAQLFNEFKGTANAIAIEDGAFGKQVHIEIEPEDASLVEGSKTGKFHEWLRLTPKTTETTVPSGSTLDAYLREVEGVFPAAKNVEKVMDALNYLLGKKILYRKKQLGRKFEGKEAADHWVPVALV